MMLASVTLFRTIPKLTKLSLVPLTFTSTVEPAGALMVIPWLVAPANCAPLKLKTL